VNIGGREEISQDGPGSVDIDCRRCFTRFFIGRRRNFLSRFDGNARSWTAGFFSFSVGFIGRAAADRQAGQYQYRDKEQESYFLRTKC